MAYNHNFSAVVVGRDVVAGPCSKCALTRNQLLDNSGILQGCQFPDRQPGNDQFWGCISITQSHFAFDVSIYLSTEY